MANLPACAPIHMYDTDPADAYLAIEAGDPPTSALIEELGHEPGGYFWEGVVAWLTKQGQLPEQNLDPESSMFVARGSVEQLEQLAQALTPYLTDDAAMRELIAAADAAGHDFDD